MGRAAYSRGGSVLPVPAREEAEQGEHENDDQDDPEDAHVVTPLSFAWVACSRNANCETQKSRLDGRLLCREGWDDSCRPRVLGALSQVGTPGRFGC